MTWLHACLPLADNKTTTLSSALLEWSHSSALKSEIRVDLLHDCYCHWVKMGRRTASWRGRRRRRETEAASVREHIHICIYACVAFAHTMQLGASVAPATTYTGHNFFFCFSFTITSCFNEKLKRKDRKRCISNDDDDAMAMVDKKEVVDNRAVPALSSLPTSWCINPSRLVLWNRFPQD